MDATPKFSRQFSMTRKQDVNVVPGFRVTHDFFSGFLRNLVKTNVSQESVKQSFAFSQSISLEDFVHKIQSFDPSQDGQTIQNLFKALTKESTLDGKKFIKELKREEESSESSEISSPSEGEFEEQHIDTERLENLFEIIAFKLAIKGIVKEVFCEIAERVLGVKVDSKILTKFFLMDDWRIEDGPDRNLLISFLLGGKKSIVTQSVFGVIAEKCFGVVEKEGLAGEKEIFLEECRKVDKWKRGYLNWGQIRAVVEQIGWSYGAGFKFHCFCIAQSLDYIPYSLI